MGQKRQERWGSRHGNGVFGNSGRACGGAGGSERSASPALIEVVFGNGLGVGGIEAGGLVEVVGKGFPGGLVVFQLAVAHGELGLGWAPGGVEERG